MNCRKCNKQITENHYEICHSCISRDFHFRKNIQLYCCICPNLRCLITLSPEFFEMHGANKLFIEKYTALYNHQFSNDETNLFLCKCRLVLKYRNEAQKIYCCYCKKTYCLTCREEDHFPEINEKHKFICPNESKLQTEKEYLSSALKTYVKQCPVCKIYISKENGCNSVLCSNCEKPFAFCCLLSFCRC